MTTMGRVRENYFDTDVAERYDDPDDPMFSEAVLGPTVAEADLTSVAVGSCA